MWRRKQRDTTEQDRALHIIRTRIAVGRQGLTKSPYDRGFSDCLDYIEKGLDIARTTQAHQSNITTRQAGGST